MMISSSTINADDSDWTWKYGFNVEYNVDNMLYRRLYVPSLVLSSSTRKHHSRSEVFY